MLSLAPIVPLPVNKFPSKVAPDALNNLLRNTPLFSFALLSIYSLIRFINEPGSSRDLNILIISFTSSFEIINFVIPRPNVIDEEFLILMKRYICC